MKILFFLLIFIPLLPNNSTSCTVFYIAKNGQIFAGNNEDWSDSATRIWFIPATEDTYGWIKFGYSGGFPQGGVNDQGVFWDATACSFLPMPYSEEHKIKTTIPVMRSIMENCQDLSSALEWLDQYYCEDQYRAQYLIGDSKSNSAIIEGDNIILKSEDYQLITNFYHSNPELGGYPCWRYERASAILDTIGQAQVWSAGAVLDATHQEGAYPTQYSLIYHLNQMKIYLFHNHNFKEILTLDIQNELSKGERYFDIAPLFSQIKIQHPANGAYFNNSAVLFQWNGSPKSSYQLYYSSDSDLKNAQCINYMPKANENDLFKTVLFLAFPIFIIGWSLRKRKTVLVVLFGLLFFSLACLKEEKDKISNPELKKYTEILQLEAGTRYYWYISAKASDTSTFNTQTLTQWFETAPILK